MVPVLLVAGAVALAAPDRNTPCPPEACVPRTVRRNIGVVGAVGEGPLVAGLGMHAEHIRNDRVLGLRATGGVGFYDQVVAPAVSLRGRAHLPLSRWAGGGPVRTNGRYKVTSEIERIPQARRRAFGPVLGLQSAFGRPLVEFLTEDRQLATQATAGLGLWTRDSFQWVDFGRAHHARFDTRMELVASAVVRVGPEDHIKAGAGDRLLGAQLDLEAPIARPGRLSFVAHAGLVPVYGPEVSIGFRAGRHR